MIIVFFCVFLFVISANGADEGDRCYKNGVPGVCLRTSECMNSEHDVLAGTLQPCGFSGLLPIVCCTSPDTTTTTQRSPVLTTAKRSVRALSSTTEYIVPTYDYVVVGERFGSPDKCKAIDPALTSKKTGRKSWDKCLEYQERLVLPCVRSSAIGGGMSRVNRCHHNADDLIVGGTNAEPLEFPHMALLVFDEDMGWFCGGTLISDKFVLTAGHCSATPARAPLKYVLLGILNRNDFQSSRDRYNVKRIIQYPDYHSPHKYHDIALVELKETVALDEYTVPACIHGGEPVDAGRASATGWGQTKRGTSNTLQKVVLTKFTTPQCAKSYRPNRNLEEGFDNATQLCYGDWTESKDTCQGDSGGPLQIKSKSIACMYTVVGVTSTGKGCGDVGYPGLYTRVAHYHDWIESIVWP